MKPALFIIGLVCSLGLSAQNSHIRRGNEFYKRELFDQAEVNYRKALEADPENAVAMHNLGNALYKQGKFEEAAKVNATLTKMSSDASVKSVAYYNQGVSHTKLNQLESSIVAYKNALKLNPNDQQARENLQKALLQQKQKQNQQQKQSSSSMSQKQADQKLKQLQQRERELQQKLNQKNQGGGGAQDW